MITETRIITLNLLLINFLTIFIVDRNQLFFMAYYQIIHGTVSFYNIWPDIWRTDIRHPNKSIYFFLSDENNFK